MVAAFDFCLHGKGGAAPSIDTAMHGLVDAPHVDHLHPDSGIALATAADGEKLTAECFGDRVAWVPWRRPGFQLGLDIAAIAAANPQAIGVVLGGHGITAWGQTSEECEARSLEIIRTAAEFIAAQRPPGAVRPGHRGLRAAARGASGRPARRRWPRSSAAWPRPTGRRSATTPTPTWCSTSCPGPSIRGWPRWARRARTTSCAPRCGRWCWTCRRTPRWTEVVARLRELHAAYRADYAAYYQRHAGPDSPPMRGADPAIVLVPGIGMFSYGADQADRPGGRGVLRQRDQRDARRRGGVDATAPIDEAEKFRIEYWALEEAKLPGMPKPKPLADPDRPGHRGGVRASAGPSPAGWPPRAPAWWWPTGTPAAPKRWRPRLGNADVAVAVHRGRDRRGAGRGGGGRGRRWPSAGWTWW